MLTCCNLYKNKNHQILNSLLIKKSTYTKDENDLSTSNENYQNEDVFSFLSKKEFYIIYELMVRKTKRKILAKKLNLSIYKLKEIEDRTKLKLSKNLNIFIS